MLSWAGGSQRARDWWGLEGAFRSCNWGSSKKIPSEKVWQWQRGASCGPLRRVVLNARMHPETSNRSESAAQDCCPLTGAGSRV